MRHFADMSVMAWQMAVKFSLGPHLVEQVSIRADAELDLADVVVAALGVLEHEVPELH